MPRYDFKCPKCGTIRADVTVSNWHSATGDEMPYDCPKCGKRMVKQPSAPNFKVTGFNAKNHYGAKHD